METSVYSTVLPEKLGNVKCCVARVNQSPILPEEPEPGAAANTLIPALGRQRWAS